MHVNRGRTQFGAVLRAEDGAIRIGARTNIQDNSVVHCEAGAHVHIGDDVTIGHITIIHGAFSSLESTLNRNCVRMAQRGG